ncbi:MAG TPA: phosphodiester glycosidase family protein [Elainellaceae cyanobacterium]
MAGRCSGGWWIGAGFIMAIGVTLALMRGNTLPSLGIPTYSHLPAQTELTPKPAPAAALHYERYSLPTSWVHVLRIPAQPDSQHGAQRYEVIPLVADELETIEWFAERSRAIAVLNGGFFDPVNQATTSYITQQGVLVADPRQNERLVNNPDLAPYIDSILTRSEFRRYQCGSQVRYDITRHNVPIPASCELLDSLGAGPQLLPDMTLEAEGFVDSRDGTVIRDAIGSRQRTARTAIGITDHDEILWVMVAQRSDIETPSGMSLPELTEFMAAQGATKALNLDGGSSSSFYYDDTSYYGRLNQDGNSIQRPVKSVLVVRSNPP